MPDHASENRPLWAPWRMEYILAPKDGACFICEKAARCREDVETT